MSRLRHGGHERSPADYPISSPENYFIVAEDEGNIVGFGQLDTEPGDHLETSVDGEIGAIYVHPDHAREGFGSNLHRRLEARARELGFNSLGLWASLNSIPFYEALGYRVVTDHNHTYGDEIELTVTEMVKNIDQ